MKKTIATISSLIGRFAALLLAVVCMSGCNGPANPEPVMINTGSIFLQESQPGQVSLTGGMGAADNADWMIVQNLDGAGYIDGVVDGAGAFDLFVEGLAVDRYRLIAVSDAGGFASRVVTTNGTDPEVVVVSEGALGCLTVDPPYLDLGSGPSGDPLYGEVTVTNGCADPLMFLTLDTLSTYFTAVSLVTSEPLESGAQAVVSVVFIAPPGEYEAQLTMDPDVPIPDPEQVSLQVVLRAEALP